MCARTHLPLSVSRSDVRLGPTAVRSTARQTRKTRGDPEGGDLRTVHLVRDTREAIAGKCASMPVAVPAAGLYTRHMYKQIAKLPSDRGFESVHRDPSGNEQSLNKNERRREYWQSRLQHCFTVI